MNRIVSDPGILGGKPCVQGTRISVEFVLELIASGATTDDILHAYPSLAREDVVAAVLYAAGVLRNESILEVEVAH